MPRYFRKLETHSDRDEIVRRIAKGEPCHLTSQSLRERYPKDESKWIKHELLYAYRLQEYPEVAKQAKKVQYKRKLATERGKKFKPKKAEDDSDDVTDIATKIMELTGQEPRAPEPRRAFTDEQVMSWVERIDGFKSFTEDMIIERGEKVKLQDFQIEMARLFINEDLVCICAAGQVGKDFMLQNYIIWKAITHAGSLQMTLCATQSQSLALMNRIIDKLEMSGDLRYCYLRPSIKPEPTLYFKNGSRALFLTSKSAIAGHTDVSQIYINEARDVRDVEVARVTPLLGISGGKLVVLSRPRFRRGYFWNCYNSPAFKTMTLPTETNKYFDLKTLENHRKTMTPALFKTEHLAQFADAGSSYFSERAIDKCSMGDYDFSMISPEPNYDYSLGIDPARLRDTSALIVVGQHRDRNHVPRYKVAFIHGFSPDKVDEPATFIQQRTYIKFLHADLLAKNNVGFKHIIPEYVGLGIGFADDLIEDWRRDMGSPSLIKPRPVPSATDKVNLYNFTKNIIDTHNIQIPRSAFRLINELKLTQFGATTTGKPRIETAVTDDYADALCLALIAFKKPFEIGIATVKLPRARLPILTR